MLNTDAIMLARYRREVADNQNFVACFIAANEGKHRILMIVDDAPVEAARITIPAMQRRIVSIAMVEIAHQPLYAVVPVVFTF